MSKWTKINGSIRIDGLGIDGMSFNDIKDVEEIMGKTCNFESTEKEFEECSVPCGSEGSLQYSIVRAGNGMVLWTVSIWGDLRDYEDLDAVENWFEKVLQSEDITIRSAIMEVSCCTGNKFFQYSDGKLNTLPPLTPQSNLGIY